MHGICKGSSGFGQTWPRDISLSVTGPDKGAKHTVLCANNVSQSPAFICIHRNYEGWVKIVLKLCENMLITGKVKRS